MKVKRSREKGRILISDRDYKKGECIGISNCVPINKYDLSPISLLWSYVFDSYNDKDTFLLVMSDFSLMSDSKNPNVIYNQIPGWKMEFTALKDIKSGDELTINYGYDIRIHNSQIGIDTEAVNDTMNDESSKLYRRYYGFEAELKGLTDEAYDADDLVTNYHSSSRGKEITFTNLNGKGRCSFSDLPDQVRIGETVSGKSGKSYVHMMVSFDGIGDNLKPNKVNSEFIFMYNSSKLKCKSAILNCCLAIMLHMRNRYQKPSYNYDTHDYEVNIPNDKVKDLFNSNLEMTSICMRIAFMTDLECYFDRFPDRIKTEYNSLNKMMDIPEKGFNPDPNEYWSSPYIEHLNFEGENPIMMVDTWD